jgi:transposase-like protein
MKGHGSKFGRKKEAAIVALLTQRNIDEAARAIDVATNTLLKWMKLPEFQAAYREARRAAHGQSIARLQQATSAAVSTLLKVMVDASTPASTKVRAADSVLNHSAKSIEIEDIEVRVAELERAAEASKPGHARGNR